LHVAVEGSVKCIGKTALMYQQTQAGQALWNSLCGVKIGHVQAAAGAQQQGAKGGKKNCLFHIGIIFPARL
jgi:hypothetical protein